MNPHYDRLFVLEVATTCYLRTCDPKRLDSVVTDDALSMAACATLVDEVLAYVRSGQPVVDDDGRRLDAGAVWKALPPYVTAEDLVLEVDAEYFDLVWALKAKADGKPAPDAYRHAPLRLGPYEITTRGRDLSYLIARWAENRPEGRETLGRVLTRGAVTDEGMAEAIRGGLAWMHEMLEIEVDGVDLPDILTREAEEIARRRDELLGKDFADVLRFVTGVTQAR